MGKGKPRGPQPIAIKLTERQKEEMERISRSQKMAHVQVLRAKVILQAEAGKRNAHIATDVDCHVNTVRTWRGRWAEAQEALAEAETEMEVKEYKQMVREILADNPRSGSPGKFSAEQLCQIIAVACQPPEEMGCPVTHWTPRELANEVVRQEIVESISPRHIGRFLKGGGLEAASDTVLANQ